MRDGFSRPLIYFFTFLHLIHTFSNYLQLFIIFLTLLGFFDIFYVMRALEKEFVSSNFCFKQIFREGMFAIYERRWENSENRHYEVIKIQSHNGYEMNGTKYPPSEYYPSANTWGTNGWTYQTREEAYAKIDSIMKESDLNKQKKTK